jgi:hypothetical protein
MKNNANCYVIAPTAPTDLLKSDHYILTDSVSTLREQLSQRLKPIVSNRCIKKELDRLPQFACQSWDLPVA